MHACTHACAHTCTPTKPLIFSENGNHRCTFLLDSYTHSEVSAMSENSAGYNFPKAFQQFCQSTFSTFVILLCIPSWDANLNPFNICTFKNIKNSYRATTSIVTDPTLVFVFWPKITLLEVIHGKQHCHDANFTCPVKDCIYFKNAML
jgi:hypothetical protein